MSAQATSTTQSSPKVNVYPWCDVCDWCMVLGYGAHSRTETWSFSCDGCRQQLTEEDARRAATREEYAEGCSCEQKCNTRHRSIIATKKNGTEIIYFK